MPMGVPAMMPEKSTVRPLTPLERQRVFSQGPRPITKLLKKRLLSITLLGLSIFPLANCSAIKPYIVPSWACAPYSGSRMDTEKTIENLTVLAIAQEEDCK